MISMMDFRQAHTVSIELGFEIWFSRYGNSRIRKTTSILQSGFYLRPTPYGWSRYFAVEVLIVVYRGDRGASLAITSL
ncbi:uncharacterized protein LAJ45_03538 [Morchella importuna]|uniref:uncharacterized protein n=1 Tax=Morchella importuna TaxID=1174673 RepID=UPI001E8D5912|nr:uncharacterized protein LAJ45_03538 [Morchella importuna]KAH8152696.1 hypothetical protein LAJ45_03538 [Morchella importuna]